MIRLGLASLMLAACSGSPLTIDRPDGGVAAFDLAPPDLVAPLAPPDLATNTNGSVACPAANTPCAIAGGNLCCVSQAVQASCVPGPCGPNDYGYACDGPEDCPGTLCCFDLAQRGASCATDCGTSYRLCHADGDCPAGQHCDQLEWGPPPLFACVPF